MATRKSMRRGRTRGRGHKKGRGAGLRGGRGNAGSHKTKRVMYERDLRAALQRMLDSDQPYVLDVIVPYTEHVLPFIPAGHTVADMIY